MNNISYEIVDMKKFRTVYPIIKKWDTKHTYYVSKNKDYKLDYFFSRIVLLYYKDILVSCGTIHIPPKGYKKYSFITNPKYRKMGLGTKILELLINISKYDYRLDSVRIEVLKSNLECIDFVEKRNFNFVMFDDDIITYELNLKK